MHVNQISHSDILAFSHFYGRDYLISINVATNSQNVFSFGIVLLLHYVFHPNKSIRG